jgi:hypothetical protein
MKRLAILACLTIGFVAGCSKSPQDLLVGKWTGAGYGDLELTKEGNYYEDGKKIGTYVVLDKETLQLTDEPNPTTGQVISEKVKFTVSETQLSITTADGTRTFTRNR